MLYDEIEYLLKKIREEFSDIVTVEEIGRSTENRPLHVYKFDATKYFDKLKIKTNPSKKALLMTGLHHARELVSGQMPLYTVLDILHGLVNQREEAINILKYT